MVTFFFGDFIISARTVHGLASGREGKFNRTKQWKKQLLILRKLKPEISHGVCELPGPSLALSEWHLAFRRYKKG